MLRVLDLRLEGQTSELFALIARDHGGIELVDCGEDTTDADVLAYRPENPWMNDALHAERYRREGKTHFLDAIAPQHLDRVASGRARLVIDNSRESTVLDPPTFLDLHAEIEKRGLPASAFVFVSPNKDLQRQYASFCHNENIQCPLIVTYHNYFFSACAETARQVLTPLFRARVQQFRTRLDYPDRLKEFVCINFAPRVHRVYLLLQILRLKLDEHAMLSIPDLRRAIKGMELDQVINQVREIFPMDPALEESWERLVALSPMTVDADNSDYIPLEFRFPSRAALGSLYSVTTETQFLAPYYEHMSEKVLKPYACFHPSILVCNVHSLQFMSTLGFESFHPLINEHYDSIEDPIQRLAAIVEEIERIHGMSIDQRRDWAVALWPRALHNAEHLVFRLRSVIHRMWDEPLLSLLAEGLPG
jgi:hypothetical protein